MLIKQLSIFVENKKGRMADITRTLAAHGIDIRALSLADTTDYGILRLIVDDPKKAVLVLKEEHMTVALTDVIAISVPDVPGGLSHAVEVLAAEGIDIEYMYASLGAKGDLAFVILRVEDNEKAVSLLEAGGISLMNAEELYHI